MAIRVNSSAKKSHISIQTTLTSQKQPEKPTNISQSKSSKPEFNFNLNRISRASANRKSDQQPRINFKLSDHQLFNSQTKLITPRIRRSRSASLEARSYIPSERSPNPYLLQPKSGISTLKTPHPTMIQKGEAGVHHGIEREATGSETGLSDSNSTEEMYAGNWMRDFSQLNVPLVHQMLGQIPSRIDAPQGETIGAKGAEDLATGLIRALAMLEFGPDITNQLITPENIGVYTPEQHIDNPMGTTSADHLVNGNEAEVIAHIQARNRTRNARQ
ncbi:MAG: hypothetical protein QNJ60_05755 [Xenococcaceae cyanobacterium MO_188.B19]|nr:hypothetical protein [Xenococcaceae cyanobacterium MO_188.B19]